MSLEPVRFLLFSTAEAVAVFALMVSLFRIRVTPFIGQVLFIILLMNVQSYMLREELALAYIVPIINILLYMFLITSVLKIPVLWSGIISISGYFTYAVIQSVVLKTIFAGMPMTELKGGSIQGSWLQVATSAIVLVLSWLLYRYRIGFTADFEKLRFKWEVAIVAILITCSMAAGSFMLYNNDIWLNIAYFAMAAGFFLYYTFKREGHK